MNQFHLDPAVFFGAKVETQLASGTGTLYQHTGSLFGRLQARQAVLRPGCPAEIAVHRVSRAAVQKIVQALVPYEGQSFDLGEAIAQSFGLAVDPYARGPEADIAREDNGLDKPETGGAFAALAALRKD